MLMATTLNQSEPDLKSMMAAIEPARLRATVEKLASFQTRNTLSATLPEAAEWLAGEYRKIPGMKVEVMTYAAPKGRRVPEDRQVVQVVATLPGADDRMVLVGGHMDSLNLQADVMTGRAPGANDDASGTAAALEIARAMAGRKWAHTLVFVGFTGEEQGLLGSRALAQRAKAEGWKLDAVLSNDTVGSSGNKAGQADPRRVRIFSAEWAPRATAAGAPEANANPRHNSRELARFIEFATRGKVADFGVKLVMRQDRYGRGGDHTPFAEEGFSAVRLVEVHEEYTRQHTPDDLPEFMDWNYLANVARLNLVAMSALAEAGAPPEDVRIDLRQGHDTTLTWKAAPAVRYVVYWRDTGSPVWQGSREVGATGTATIAGVNKDDNVFAVGAVGGVPILAR